VKLFFNDPSEKTVNFIFKLKNILNKINLNNILRLKKSIRLDNHFSFAQTFLCRPGRDKWQEAANK
jgi:hypothetical protein